MRNSERRPRRRTNRSGQSLVEFVLVLPILLALLLGVIEFGRSLDVKHSLSTLSREGANLAARGTQLDTVVTAVIGNGGDIDLVHMGGVIASEVAIVGGVPILQAQSFSAGFSRPSLLGSVGARVAALDSLGLLNGNRHYVVEIFYRMTPITPLKSVLGVAPPDTLYDRAVF